MDLGLTGRTVMVAGASTGLGLAVAETLVGEGANVSIATRRAEQLEQAASALRERGTGTVLACPLDVRDDDAVHDWVRRTVDEAGPPEIVVANAGGPPAGPASSFSRDDYRDALELNLTASVGLVLAALPHIRAAGSRGRILFITSISVKQPVAGLALSNTARPGFSGSPSRWSKTSATPESRSTSWPPGSPAPPGWKTSRTPTPTCSTGSPRTSPSDASVSPTSSPPRRPSSPAHPPPSSPEPCSSSMAGRTEA